MLDKSTVHMKNKTKNFGIHDTPVHGGGDGGRGGIERNNATHQLVTNKAKRVRLIDRDNKAD